MGKYFHSTMVLSLFDYMRKTPYEITPYVNTLFGALNRGISAYNDCSNQSIVLRPLVICELLLRHRIK